MGWVIENAIVMLVRTDDSVSYDGIWNPDGTIKCGVVVPCGLVWKC